MDTTWELTGPAPRPGRPGLRRNARRAAYTAFGWVMVFLAWHIVWAATGLPVPTGAGQHGSARVLTQVLTVVLLLMVAVGTALPLALAQAWGRRVPQPVLLLAAWTGCALLGGRGLAGIGDDIVRVTGVLPNGLTGMTMEEVAGTAHPSAWAVFAGGFTDLLFTAGGIAFGLAALTYRRAWRPRHLTAGTG